MATISNPLAIRAVQLSAQMACVRLEKRGFRHSGGNITPALKKLYGLSRSATHDDVLAKLQEDRDAVETKLLKEAKNEHKEEH